MMAWTPSLLLTVGSSLGLAGISHSALAQEDPGDAGPQRPPAESVEPPADADGGAAVVQPASVRGARRAEQPQGGSQPWYDAAVARDRESKEMHARWEANYRRNIYALQVAFGREILPTITRGYAGRVEFAMLLPSEDGASSLIAITAGLSGWGSDDAWGFGVPVGVGWGYRSPAFVFYLGPSFGIGVDTGTEPAAGAYGGFGAAGIDLGGVRVMLDSRAEYRIMKYGDSRWHLGYGLLASVNL